MAETPSPFDIYVTNLQNAEDCIRETREEARALETQLTGVRQTIERTERGKARLVERFYDRLGEADDIYRAVFEISFAREPLDLLKDTRKARAADQIAKQLQLLNGLIEGELPQTVMIARLQSIPLVDKPQNDQDFAQAASVTILRTADDARVTPIYASEYKGGIGKITNATDLVLPIVQKDEVQTRVNGFDDASWVDAPFVRSNTYAEEPHLYNLRSLVLGGFAVADEITFDNSDRIFVGQEQVGRAVVAILASDVDYRTKHALEEVYTISNGK